MTEKLSRSLTAASVCSVISSLPILLCIWVSQSESKLPTVIMALIFWIFAVLEQLFIVKASNLRKAILKENPKKSRRRQSEKVGIISFFETPPGACADCVSALSLIVLAVCIIFELGTDLIQFLILFLFVLSFRFHCIFNGKNFRYKYYLKQRGRKNHENKG